MRPVRVLLVLLALGVACATGSLCLDAWHRVEDSSLELTGDPSRVYSMSPRLAVGDPLVRDELVALLGALDAHPIINRDKVTARVQDHVLDVTLAGGAVRSLSVDGAARDSVGLPPVLLATWLGPAMIEHRRVALKDVPPHVVRAVLAAEDAGFFHHPGVSPKSIARAAWANVCAGRVRQGGSTITQQLVKNVYLDPRRTLVRKVREAALAFALEVKDDKKQILEAYLNEIYMGHDGPVQMVGLGAASRGWFGKEPSRLTLSEAALLAGMIHNPGAYDPRTNPGPAQARRDHVLARMASLGWITSSQAQVASAEPVVVADVDPMRIDAPWFARAAAVEASQRYGVDVDRETGLTVYSTLDWIAQRRAERSLADGLARLDRSIERGYSNAAHPLEGALVSLDPADGAIRAYVGGRDRARSTFDRARQSRRMLGSAFKPVVYAAALEAGYVEPYTLLGDTAWSLDLGDRTWTPHNYDRTYHGLVPAQQALAYSLNVPAAQVAMETGLDQVSGLARRMGIVSPIDVQPAIALGAVSAAPIELASVFGAFADGGVAHAPHGIERIVDRDGNEVYERFVPGSEVVLSKETAYEMTSMLRAVVDQGTGAGARAYVTGPLAGKTGTSDDRRDAWFAGYSADRVTVVWTGYDDNRPTRLSGATGALPMWADFMRAMRPRGGYREFDRPSSIVEVTIDPTTGYLAGPDCPMRITVELPDYRVPYFECSHTQDDYETPGYDDEEADTTGVLAELAPGAALR